MRLKKMCSNEGELLIVKGTMLDICLEKNYFTKLSRMQVKVKEKIK